MIAGDPQVLDYAIWIAISFAGAALSYRFVESPFRQKNRIAVPSIVRGFSLATVCIVLAVGALHWGRGFEQRFPRLMAAYGKSEMDNGFAQEASWAVLDALAPNEKVSNENADIPSTSEQQRLWFDPESGSRKYLVVGNSHSKDTFNALYLNQDLFAASEFARYAISNAFLPEEIAGLRDAPNYLAADEIVVSTRFQANSLEGLERIALQAQADGKAVTIMGPSPEYDRVENLPLFDWFKQRAPEDFDADDLAALAWEMRRPVEEGLRAEIANIAEKADATVLGKARLTCNKADQECHVMTPDGLKVHYDYGHFTLEGARWTGQRMHELDWFE